MRTIAIANQKGGCGKTTTAVNLAAGFAEKSCRTLLIDLDPQGHSTIGFGYEPDELSTTIYDALVNGPTEIAAVTLSTKVEWLDLAPSNVQLSSAEFSLNDIAVLSKKLRTVSPQYDVCIIDCPPSLGLLTLNALHACTGVVVPVQVHYYAMEGMKQLFETVNALKEHFHSCDVRILGILLTFVENNTLLSRQVQHEMREFFGDFVFRTVIHKNVRLAEAPSAGEPVLVYSRASKAAAEYRALTQEIIDGWTLVEQIRTLAEEMMDSRTLDAQAFNQETPVRR